MTAGYPGLGGGGGGGGFTLGPAQNVFTGATRTAAETARDTYFTANPTNLASYNADTTLNIRLEYTSGSNTIALFQVRNGAGDTWLDNSSAIGVAGQAGQDGSDGSRFEFATEAERDTFFAANLDMLIAQLPISVTVDVDTVAIQTWGGATNPASYDNTLWRASSIRSGTQSFELDEAIVISSGGENVVFTSKNSNIQYHPLWQNYTAGRQGAVARMRDAEQTFVAQPTDTDTITNPNWTQNIAAARPVLNPGTSDEDGQTVHWVEYNLDASSVTTNIRIQSFLNNVKFLEENFPTVTRPDSGIVRFEFTNPFDAFVGDDFENLITSVDGDVVLLGDSGTGVPYINVNAQFFNDEPIALLSDILTTSPPVVTQFRIQGQATSVAAGTALSGSQTFQYQVTNTDQITGMGVIRQGSTVLTSAVSPTGSSITQSINPVNLAAGESVVWTLEFTTTAGTTISRTFTVRARQQAESLYWGVMPTDEDDTIAVDTLTLQEVVAGTQFDADFDIPNTQYAVILSPADREISSILEQTFNQEVLTDFAKTENVRTIGGQQYDSYVHQNNAGTQGILSTRITVSQ